MIDTITIFKEKGKLNESDLLADLRIEMNNNGELIGKKARLKNLYLKENQNGLLINGSLSRFYFGNNLFTLQRNDLQRAIELLNTYLGTDIRDGKVFRIDLATTILCNNKPFEYFSNYGDMNHFRKNFLANKQTLLYEKTTERLLLYDKLKEIQRKKDTAYLPKEFENKNLLRIETRLIKRIAKTLGINEVRTSDLYNEDFYIKLIDKHKENYYSIKRQPSLTINKEFLEMINANNFTDYLALIGIKQIGIESLFSLIESEYRASNITYSKYYRLKSKLEKLVSNKELLKETNLINEIDEKFNNSISNYR